MVTSAEQLSHGACVGLPMAVIDKYFMADGLTERFQWLTAQAICGRCPVRVICLAEAIALPTPSIGIRGGETPQTLKKLHHRYTRGEASAQALAALAIQANPAPRGAGSVQRLRAGEFPDMPLLPTPPWQHPGSRR